MGADHQHRIDGGKSCLLTRLGIYDLKHGVLGLTRSALETAKLGVTVNAICPGYVDTELTRENARRMADKTGKSIDEILKLFAESSPQKRLIAPAEVAGLALMRGIGEGRRYHRAGDQCGRRGGDG